jgi:hypothetical protein
MLTKKSKVVAVAWLAVWFIRPSHEREKAHILRLPFGGCRYTVRYARSLGQIRLVSLSSAVSTVGGDNSVESTVPFGFRNEFGSLSC